MPAANVGGAHALHGADGIGPEKSKPASERSAQVEEMPVRIEFLASGRLAIPA